MLKPKHKDTVSRMTRSILIVCLLSQASAATAMELGYLFFSPHERDRMDRARWAPFACLKVSGVVVKTGGEQIIWVDKIPGFSQGARTDGVNIEASRHTPTSVEVRVNTDDAVTLRPGETLDVIGGGVRNGFDTDQQPCTS